jgi:hypothetical protein
MSRGRGSRRGCTGRREVERLRPRARGVFLTDQETAALLRELDGLIEGDRYFMSPRMKTLKAIRARLRPEPAREPFAGKAIRDTADDSKAETACGRRAARTRRGTPRNDEISAGSLGRAVAR